MQWVREEGYQCGRLIVEALQHTQSQAQTQAQTQTQADTQTVMDSNTLLNAIYSNSLFTTRTYAPTQAQAQTQNTQGYGLVTQGPFQSSQTANCSLGLRSVFVTLVNSPLAQTQAQSQTQRTIQPPGQTQTTQTPTGNYTTVVGELDLSGTLHTHVYIHTRLDTHSHTHTYTHRLWC